jgi:hypothetical protein
VEDREKKKIADAINDRGMKKADVIRQKHVGQDDVGYRFNY